MVLQKTGCPPIPFQFIRSFHEGMKAVVQFNGSTSDSFEIRIEVKKACVLAQTHFNILLQFIFKVSLGNACLHWRTAGSLFNLTCFRAETKTKSTLIRDFLFADGAALVAHCESTLRTMMERLSQAFEAFFLVISIKMTVVLTQISTTEDNIMLDN